MSAGRRKLNGICRHLLPFPPLVLLAAFGLFTFIAVPISKADTTWNYAVQISATVQSAPPQITLTWPQDDYGAVRYTAYRKAKADTSWGTGTILAGTTTTYTDTAVVVGTTYEYQIIKDTTVGYKGYGYVFSGIEAPLVEERGKLILIVDNRHATALASELARLQSDLTGEGWTVMRHDVSPNDTPGSVRNLITTDYNADPTKVNTVFLFGLSLIHI